MTIAEITNASQRRLAEQAYVAFRQQQAANSAVAFALQQLEGVGMEVLVTGGEILSFDFTLPTPTP